MVYTLHIRAICILYISYIWQTLFLLYLLYVTKMTVFWFSARVFLIFFSIHSLCYIMFGCILLVCAPLTISSSFGAAHFGVCSSNNKRCGAVCIVKTQFCWFYSFFFLFLFLFSYDLVIALRFMQENVCMQYTFNLPSHFFFFFLFIYFFLILKYTRSE